MRFDPAIREAHGTRACYKTGCRCAECREANRLYLLAYNRRTGRRREPAAVAVARHRHPSLNCYKRHGCRCPLCRAFNTFDVRHRAERRAWR